MGVGVDMGVRVMGKGVGGIMVIVKGMEGVGKNDRYMVGILIGIVLGFIIIGDMDDF